MTYNQKNMKTRAEFLRSLRESAGYKHALSRATSDAERRAIDGFVSQFVCGFADVLAPLISRAESDPGFAAQLGQALITHQQVVTETIHAVTGSSETD